VAFPIVQSRATGGQDSDSTSHVVTMPSGITAGDLLVAVIGFDGTPTVSDGSGLWTVLAQSAASGAQGAAILYKFATGGDSLTATTSASEQSSHVVLRISGALSVTSSSAATNAGATNPNPNSHTPAGGAADFLWVAIATTDGTVVPSAAMANYTNLTTRAGGASGCGAATAERSLNAATENPAAFAATTTAWTAYTIAVRPTVATDAPAGHASGTGTAHDATVTVTPAAGHASGTGTAHSPTASVTPAAGHASGTGAATDPAAAIAPAAEHASGTGAANAASAAVTPAAGHASGTGTANDPTIDANSTAAEAPAGHASGVGAAHNATVRVASDAGGGNWRDLMAVLADARLMAREDATQSPVACPNDGEPLRSGPRGQLFCPFDGWRP
jgi:hypothetical protein